VHAGDAGQGKLGLRKLPLDPPVRLKRQVRVGEGVQAYLMSVLDDPTDEFRIAGNHGPGDEERGLRMVFREDVEDLGRPPRVGTVVEGEGDGAARGGVAARLDSVLHLAGVDHRSAVQEFRRDGGLVHRDGDPLVVEDLIAEQSTQNQHREQGHQQH
jgi:hypothetical protein